MNIRSARKKIGLTQHQLAALTGVSRSTVAMWETGKTGPRFDKVVALSIALGITPNELLDTGQPDRAS